MHSSKAPNWLYRGVVEWSRGHLRDFPWRETTDPYRVFLAECLLKRTTSTAALRVYNRLLEKYPDISSLALAKDIEDDLRPVGLYRQRGKLILRAARYVVHDLGGSFPKAPGELAEIPGIGKYSASAIVSFAFGDPVPTVDSNVVRVLRRFRGENQLDLEDCSAFLASAINNNTGRRFNLAMIDLGSIVCRPVRPICSECPLATKCEYKKVSPRQS